MLMRVTCSGAGKHVGFASPAVNGDVDSAKWLLGEAKKGPELEIVKYGLRKQLQRILSTPFGISNQLTISSYDSITTAV
jgi:hypothetical protein